MSTKPEDQKKTCFVIMPISTPDGYDAGHFDRVYSHLIKPACENLNLEIKRADDVKNTNYIIIDILKRIVNSDIVICDLSAKNPNVMYELGIRQAFNLPTVLIKDIKTERVFDIHGLRTMDYDENMRVDLVEKDIVRLHQTIEETLSSDKNEINSLIQLLEIPQAELSSNTKLSPDTTVILDYIRDVSQRLTNIEDNFKNQTTLTNNPGKTKISKIFKLPNGENVEKNEEVFDKQRNRIGYFQGYLNEEVLLTQEDGGGKSFTIPPNDPNYKYLSTLPF